MTSLIERLEQKQRERLDTIEARWARLEAATQVFGSDDDVARPAVLLFHGCGGLRPHLPKYAEAAVEAGCRAFIVDSYGARGWPQLFGLTFVCTGAVFRGRERAGDILATIWGVSRRRDVDASRIAVAGWSHGGWGIMELMAAPLARSGEIGLADSHAGDLSGVKGAFLVYPYVGVGATARFKPWLRRPKTYAVIARHDHLTTVRNAEKVYEAVRGSGVEVEAWTAEGTHSFDEPMNAPPMRYDETLAGECVGRFRRFLEATLAEPQAAGKPARRRRA